MAILVYGGSGGPNAKAEDIVLRLRSQVETSADSGRFHTVQREESWDPQKTAVIICDVWDAHHCLNAVRRVNEFVPRLERVLKRGRELGMTIIHSPSDCMPAYAGHAARKRAMAAPPAKRSAEGIGDWCSRIPAEERAVYPLDQSDGGEDDDAAEHAGWVAQLKQEGRNPGTPWLKQHPGLLIDPERDFITDRGQEVWNILENRGITHVVLAGVHTNMCVLGRPFGLRQLVRHGKTVVLMRDMTDTMYNPQRWPYVSHFTGTDRIISHIERYVCPTISSSQFVDGDEFRFRLDRRPHLVVLLGESLYRTDESLPRFCDEQLGHAFRVTTVFASEKDRNEFPGIEAVRDADILLVSVRRRALPGDAMSWIRRHAAEGKPIVGLRTASHAFSLGSRTAPQGLTEWRDFDQAVFGGNYHGHYPNDVVSHVRAIQGIQHDILRDVTTSFQQGGSLYKTSPLGDGAIVLLEGVIEGQEPEPLAWTNRRAGGGRSFYTSLGHVKDFDNPSFVRLLRNGLHWAAGLEIPDSETAQPRDFVSQWNTVVVPTNEDQVRDLAKLGGSSWYRSAVRIPAAWRDSQLQLSEPQAKTKVSAWLNGTPLRFVDGVASLPADAVHWGDANLIVVRIADGGRGQVSLLRQAPTLSAGKAQLKLAGRWQFRVGRDADWSNIPLPAKFGASTDFFFEP